MWKKDSDGNPDKICNICGIRRVTKNFGAPICNVCESEMDLIQMKKEDVENARDEKNYEAMEKIKMEKDVEEKQEEKIFTQQEKIDALREKNRKLEKNIDELKLKINELEKKLRDAPTEKKISW